MSNAETVLTKPDPQTLSERDQRGNIARLTIAQALAGANSIVVYATGGIVGHALAPDKALATLPISIFVIGMVVCTLPMGVVARRHGRRAAFLIGTASGVLVGLLAAAAIVLTSFWLFCLATFFGGVYAAVVLSFRFAAADGVMPERRARAFFCHGWRGSSRRCRTAAGDVDDASLDAAYVCGDLYRTSRRCRGVRTAPCRRPIAQAGSNGH